MTTRLLLTVLSGLVILLALCALNHWLFASLWGLSYATWFIAKGVQISLAAALAALAWGSLDKHSALISAHPLVFIGAHLQLIGLPIYALGTTLRHAKGAWPDRCLTLVFAVLISSGLLLWALVVAPAQYFLILLCGAPARVMQGSKQIPVAHMDEPRLALSVGEASAALGDGTWNASLAQKPVTLTQGLIALSLFVAKLWLVF